MTTSTGARATRPVSVAVARYPHTAAVVDGQARPGNVVYQPMNVEPIVAAYRRQVRGLEFDVCEMAISTYLIAREHGVPLSALPVFLNRRFHHRDVVVRDNAGIRTPRDLEGRRVGVRAYSVTSAVWARGVLAEQYGVDLDAVTWVVDDEENVASLRLPGNVASVSRGASLRELFDRGDIDAAFGGWAGVGRQGAPADWNEAQTESVAAHDLLSDAEHDERDWFHRSGWYPIHGVLTVKDETLRELPELADDLWAVFNDARSGLLERLDDVDDNDPEVVRYRELREVVGADPLPYGLENNRVSIEAALRLCRDQGLLSEPASAESSFLRY